MALVRGFRVVVFEYPLERFGRLIHDRSHAERVVLEEREVRAVDLIEVRSGPHALAPTGDRGQFRVDLDRHLADVPVGRTRLRAARIAIDGARAEARAVEQRDGADALA